MANNFADTHDEFFDFTDSLLHRSVLFVEPHPQSAEHRRRLLELAKARRDEMRALDKYESAKEILAAFFDHLSSGALTEAEDHAKFLGLPTYLDHSVALKEKAASLGISLDEQHRKSNVAQVSRDSQERLLEEGLTETFPASDPVSVSIVKY